MATDRDHVGAALEGVDYPATKDGLLSVAQSNGADEATVKALRAIQNESYANLTEVVGAVPLAHDAEHGQSDADKAQQSRQTTRAGVAEIMTETPGHPIVKELGENRGS